MKKLFYILVAVSVFCVFLSIMLSPVCDGEMCTYTRTGTRTPVVYTQATPMKRVIIVPTPTSEVITHVRPTSEVITHENK